MGFADEDLASGSDAMSRGYLLLASLTRIAVAAMDSRSAALACLEAIADELGAASGFVALASGPDVADERLEVAAMVGPHAPLLGDAAHIATNEQADVAVVFTTGEPHFVGSVYDSQDDPTDGTARWRGLISAQASALIPVGTATRRFGVIMLEWSQPQAFDADMRDLLESAGLLTALAVERTWPAEDLPLPLSTETPSVVGRQPSRVSGEVAPGEVPVLPVSAAADNQLRLELTAEGLVVARRDDDEWGSGRVRVTLPSTSRPGVLLDVHPIASGQVLLLIASVDGPTSSQLPELVEMLRHTARVLAARCETGEVLDAAAERLRELGGISLTLDAWIGVWDAVAGAITHAQSGRAGSRILMCDGRDSEGDSQTTSTWLPLSGDVIHAWVPSVASARAEWH